MRPQANRMSETFCPNAILDYSEIQERTVLFDDTQSPEQRDDDDTDQEDIEETKLPAKRKGQRKSVKIGQGFVTLNVSGYLGQQRVSLSELAGVLPVHQIREGVIKVLRRRGVKRMRQKKKVVKKPHKSRAKEEESRAECEATIF